MLWLLVVSLLLTTRRDPEHDESSAYHYCGPCTDGNGCAVRCTRGQCAGCTAKCNCTH